MSQSADGSAGGYVGSPMYIGDQPYDDTQLLSGRPSPYGQPTYAHYENGAAVASAATDPLAVESGIESAVESAVEPGHDDQAATVTFEREYTADSAAAAAENAYATAGFGQQQDGDAGDDAGAAAEYDDTVAAAAVTELDVPGDVTAVTDQDASVLEETDSEFVAAATLADSTDPEGAQVGDLTDAAVTPSTSPYAGADDALVETQPTPATTKESGMTDYQTSLKDCMQIEGSLGVALVDTTSGMALATAGDPAGIDLNVAAAGNSTVVQAKLRTMRELDLDTKIEDILITLGDQYHVIRPLGAEDGLFIYLILDKDRGNLAMARFRLGKIEKDLSI